MPSHDTTSPDANDLAEPFDVAWRPLILEVLVEPGVSVRPGAAVFGPSGKAGDYVAEFWLGSNSVIVVDGNLPEAMILSEHLSNQGRLVVVTTATSMPMIAKAMIMTALQSPARALSLDGRTPSQ